MSQSRFSIVLVGVSALLRRPLVSRLRPADGERSPWVVFTARGGRFDSGFRSASWPSGSPLPLRSGRWASSFFRLPFRSCRSAGWPSGSPLPLFGMRRFGVAAGRVGSSAFRFGDGRSASWPSGSRLPLFGTHRFGDCPRRVGSSAFRFGDYRWAGWPSDSLLPLFGMHRFGGALGGLVLPLGGLAFGFTASAFRHAPLRKLPSAGWPSGSPLLLFGTHRSAPPHRRSEDRRSTPTRHLFHFKTLIPTC